MIVFGKIRIKTMKMDLLKKMTVLKYEKRRTKKIGAGIGWGMTEMGGWGEGWGGDGYKRGLGLGRERGGCWGKDGGGGWLKKRVGAGMGRWGG